MRVRIGGVVMYAKAGQLDRLSMALSSGKSLRASAREVGCSKLTAKKLYRELIAERKRQGLGPFLCECGRVATHRGWCSVRYQGSPERQAVMQRLHSGTPAVERLTPEMLEFCEQGRADALGDEEVVEMAALCALLYVRSLEGEFITNSNAQEWTGLGWRKIKPAMSRLRAAGVIRGDTMPDYAAREGAEFCFALVLDAMVAAGRLVAIPGETREETRYWLADAPIPPEQQSENLSVSQEPIRDPGD